MKSIPVIELTSALLWGYLIPIINTTFIELNTAAYLSTFFFPRLSQGSTSCPFTRAQLEGVLIVAVDKRPDFNIFLGRI
jgi:hypothetical protein